MKKSIRTILTNFLHQYKIKYYHKSHNKVIKKKYLITFPKYYKIIKQIKSKKLIY